MVRTEGRKHGAFASRARWPVDLETHRSRVTNDRETMLKDKRFFESRGASWGGPWNIIGYDPIWQGTARRADSSRDTSRRSAQGGLALVLAAAGAAVQGLSRRRRVRAAERAVRQADSRAVERVRPSVAPVARSAVATSRGRSPGPTSPARPRAAPCGLRTSGARGGGSGGGASSGSVTIRRMLNSAKRTAARMPSLARDRPASSIRNRRTPGHDLAPGRPRAVTWTYRSGGRRPGPGAESWRPGRASLAQCLQGVELGLLLRGQDARMALSCASRRARSSWRRWWPSMASSPTATGSGLAVSRAWASCSRFFASFSRSDSCSGPWCHPSASAPAPAAAR